jgi:ADP-ribosylglycohydrolase
MSDQAIAMVKASFVADALALGVHWIYNTNVIDKKWGWVEEYIKPERPTYHPTKDLGEFTHYGDQTIVLLESLAACSTFDLMDFATRWQHFFKSYDGYFDGATKKTLENFQQGKDPDQSGSDSDDLAGAARIAPLVYIFRKDLERLIAAARAQTAMTHDNAHVIDAAEYFAKIAWGVLQGQSPVASLKRSLNDPQAKKPFYAWIEKGLNSVHDNTREAIKNLGQMCEIDAAFPCVVHLIAKYENNLKDALVENIMAGGDSAGRGLIVGFILGAHLGLDAIPQTWLTQLKAHQNISDQLQKIDDTSK